MKDIRILLCEDDPSLGRLLSDYLKAKGFEVTWAQDGVEGLKAFHRDTFDFIVLDVMMPRKDGFQVAEEIRLESRSIPILFLTARSTKDDTLEGFKVGADDYMTMPFHKDELVARIHAIVRRSKGHAQSVINTGDLLVNLDAKTVEVGGQRVHLTGKEYQMLELLSLRKGTTLTKEMFLNHLYGGMDEPELKIIDVFICKLRKKLDAASGGQNYIETVWGRGYVLREPEEIRESA